MDELRDQWDDIRKILQVFLGKINSDNKGDMVYRHPYAGPLDIAKTLHFSEIPFDNHVRHIDKILAHWT